MPTLYVTEPGSRIEKEYNRVLVVREGEVILSVPAFKISAVVLVGSVGITTQALLLLLDQGIDFSLITSSGKLRGSLRSTKARNISLLLKQVERSRDEDFKLQLSKKIVSGKLWNCRVMAMRMLRNDRENNKHKEEKRHALDSIDQCLEKSQLVSDLASLRGLEGYATRCYFSIFRETIQTHDGSLFKQRKRRPPDDPVNALLSFGYMLLTNAMITSIEVCGLDASIGFYHSNTNDKPSLALDLIEEIRPVIVDSIVLRALKEKRITKKDFTTSSKLPCCLTQKGLHDFLAIFNDRLNDSLTLESTQRPLTYQKLMEYQANQVRKMIEGGSQNYEPIRIR